jgi:hypothetical protein
VSSTIQALGPVEARALQRRTTRLIFSRSSGDGNQPPDERGVSDGPGRVGAKNSTIAWELDLGQEVVAVAVW